MHFRWLVVWFKILLHGNLSFFRIEVAVFSLLTLQLLGPGCGSMPTVEGMRVAVFLMESMHVDRLKKVLASMPLTH